MYTHIHTYTHTHMYSCRLLHQSKWTTHALLLSSSSIDRWHVARGMWQGHTIRKDNRPCHLRWVIFRLVEPPHLVARFAKQLELQRQHHQDHQGSQAPLSTWFVDHGRSCSGTPKFQP